MIFCVDPDDDTVLPVVEKLGQDFPKCAIRVLFGSGRVASNDKVAKLARMAAEARYETVVISDSDVRVQPGLPAGDDRSPARDKKSAR